MAYARVGSIARPRLRPIYRRPLPVSMKRLGMGDDVCYSGDAVIPCGTVPTGSTSVGSGSNTDWSQFWQGITGASLNILSKVVSPPAYQQVTRDAYGNVISTTVAQGAAGGPATGAALGGSISPNLLLVGGLGLFGVLLISMMSKKGS